MPAEVAEQLEAIAGQRPPPEVVAAVVERAEGNPFFAEELLAAGGGPELPPGLADVLAARLAALPGGRLRAGAGGGGRRAARRARPARNRVRARRRRAVDRPARGDVSPRARHRQRRRLCLSSCAVAGGGVRRAVARASESRCMAPTQLRWPPIPNGRPRRPGRPVSWHITMPQLAISPRALAASVAAAGAASDSYALGEAHALYEQALALWDQVPAPSAPSALAGCDRVQLLERCAEAAMLTGADAARYRTGTRCPGGARPRRAIAPATALLHWRLARLLWTSGRRRGVAGRSSRRGRPDARRADRTSERSMLAGEGHALMLAARYEESRERCEQAIEVARAVGARREEGYALNTLGGDLSRLGEPRSGGRLPRAGAEDRRGRRQHRRRMPGATATFRSSSTTSARLERAAVVGRAGIGSRSRRLGYERGRGQAALRGRPAR